MANDINESESIGDDIFGLKFDAGKSIRYHSHLRAMWRKADHFNKVFTLFSGTSVIVSLLSENKKVELAAAISTAALSAMDIVFGFSDKALVHDRFYKKWASYSADLEEREETLKTLKEFKVKRLKLEREESDIIRFVERYSSFEEAMAQGAEIAPVWNVNWLGKLIIKSFM